MLLLGLGAVGGGTVLLAQGAGTKEQSVQQPDAAPAPAIEETDLALFREGSVRFLGEDYRGADRCFCRLLERFPESPLASQSAELAITAKHMSTTNEGGSFPLERVREGRRIIDAVLAGVHAAEAGQKKGPGAPAERTRQKVNELMREYSALYEEGKYREAEMCARAALELDPGNAVAAAAVHIARRRQRQADYSEKRPPTGASPARQDKELLAGMTVPSTTLPGVTPPAQQDKESEIERILQRPVSLSIKDVPLNQVVDDLRAWHGLNIIIDRPALKKDGISLQAPVTARLQDVTLKSALNLLLRGVHLSYVIRDGAVVVTTPTAAKGRLVTQTHPIGDLAAGDAEVDALIRLIQRTLAPETWSEAGGSGTMDYYPLGKALVVNQTADVQEQIADFLAALRRLKGAGKKP